MSDPLTPGQGSASPEERAAELVKIHVTGRVQTIALDGVALAALDIESTDDECEVREQASVVRRAIAAIIRDAEARSLEAVAETIDDMINKARCAADELGDRRDAEGQDRYEDKADTLREAKAVLVSAARALRGGR